MVVLRAWFGRCQRCGRLIAVGGLNPLGACTADCGGRVPTAESTTTTDPNFEET